MREEMIGTTLDLTNFYEGIAELATASGVVDAYPERGEIIGIVGKAARAYDTLREGGENEGLEFLKESARQAQQHLPHLSRAIAQTLGNGSKLDYIQRLSSMIETALQLESLARNYNLNDAEKHLNAARVFILNY